MTSEGRTSRGVRGLGFAAGIYIAYDCMSTLNSSPWTHQTFGGDPGKAESAQHYVNQAIASSLALAALTSWLMGSWSPLVGCSVADAQLFYVYRRAGQKAKEGAGQSASVFAWTRSAAPKAA